MNGIVFTPEKLVALKNAYNGAVIAGAETFVFEGQQLLVAYAKYLIEFLDSKFGRNP